MSTSAGGAEGLCSHCYLPVKGRRKGAALRAGEHLFCCYGCSLAFRIVGNQAESSEASWLLARVAFGAFLGMLVMTFSLLLYSGSLHDLGPEIVPVARKILLGLSVPVVVMLGWPFLRNAAREFRYASCSMDSLVALGVFAAFLYSAWSVLRGEGHIYFDSATMVLVLVTLGKYLESSVRARTTRQLRNFLQGEEVEWTVEREDGEHRVLSSRIEVGDQFDVKPGDRIPVDGVLVWGRTTMDESLLTGESAPQVREEGSTVRGGSLSLDGSVRVRATAAAADSTAGKLVALLEQARSHRGPTHRIVDRVSGVFVPSVLGVAALTFLFWLSRGGAGLASLNALSVLVIACPCALGLATPLAVFAGIGRAAREGLLVGSGDLVERMARASVVCFDKTGTLTEGNMRMADFLLAPDAEVDEGGFLSILGSLEGHTRHSIGRSLASLLTERELPVLSVEGFTNQAGRGIEGWMPLHRATVVALPLLVAQEVGEEAVCRGEFAGVVPSCAGGSPHAGLAVGAKTAELIPLEERPTFVMAGSETFVREKGLHLDPILLATKTAWEAEGRTPVFCGWDGRVRGAVALADRLRAEAGETVRRCRDLGLSVVLMSGDRAVVARKIGAQAGIDRVESELRPAQKVAAIDALREAGQRVIMVGDGINDAPALAKAEVGVAVGSGADLAKESAHVNLLGTDLRKIPWLVALSRYTYRRMQENLFWAFLYNGVGIALATMGWLNPILAALAMVASSLIVVANSLRLRGVPGPASW